MAKKTISRLSVLVVLIVFLAACSKTVEYTNIIPADATVVTSINLKSLTSKAGLNDKENEAAKQKVLEALKSGMNAATFQQLEKVMKNPGESGIDVESPFYVFLSAFIFLFYKSVCAVHLTKLRLLNLSCSITRNICKYNLFRTLVSW